MLEAGGEQLEGASSRTTASREGSSQQLRCDQCVRWVVSIPGHTWLLRRALSLLIFSGGLWTMLLETS